MGRAAAAARPRPCAGPVHNGAAPQVNKAYAASRSPQRLATCPGCRGGVEKNFAPGKNFRGGLGSRALPAKKKLSQYFHSIWNFFLQGVGGQISCGKLVNVAAL